MNKNPEIVVITGKIRQGKTTFVRNLADDLKKENLRISGILAIGKDENGLREGFDLLNIYTGETMTICTISPDENFLHSGKYYFDPVAFQTGNKWLKDSIKENPDIIITDELGPLELEGKGWSPAMDYLLKKSNAFQIWVIRIELVEKILSRWDALNSTVFDINSESPESVRNFIMEKLK